MHRLVKNALLSAPQQLLSITKDFEYMSASHTPVETSLRNRRSQRREDYRQTIVDRFRSAETRILALGEHLVSKILKSWGVQARSNNNLRTKICLKTSWLYQIHLYTRSWKYLSKICRSWKVYESQWSLPKIFNKTDSDTTSEQISKLFRIPWLFNRNILK